nr:hypothetical protein [Tanacetum cinerariifolium]
MYGIRLGIKYPRDQVVQKKPSENVQKGDFRRFLVKIYVFQTSELGSDLGSELTSLAGSELGSELTFFAGSELGLASYTSSEDYFPATCEQELCPFNFLLASCQVSSSELSLASYRPPMLDRTDFASWQQRIRLYCRGKENEVNILKSIDEGPFQMGTLRETLTEGTEGALDLGPERPQVYSDLTFEKKDRYNADIQATNILLQRLPKDIYSLINHYTNAKDIWYNVKMLLEGSELTKEDCESQLMQLNSKFVDNMLPEWGRFVIAVKLNKGLRDSNYDHLTLSLMDNLIENLTNTLAILTQSYKTYLPQTNNQLQTSSKPRNQATTQDGKVVIQNVQGRQNRRQGNNARGAGHIARNCTQPKRPHNSEYFKDKMLLMQAQENGVTLDDEQLLFIAGGQDNIVDDDVDETHIQDLALNVDNVFQADDYPIYDEVGPSYDSNVLSE